MKYNFGFDYHSFWFKTLGVYYMLLTIMRLLLLRYANRNILGQNVFLEFKQ